MQNFSNVGAIVHGVGFIDDGGVFEGSRGPVLPAFAALCLCKSKDVACQLLFLNIALETADTCTYRTVQHDTIVYTLLQQLVEHGSPNSEEDSKNECQDHHHDHSDESSPYRCIMEVSRTTHGDIDEIAAQWGMNVGAFLWERNQFFGCPLLAFFF